MPDVPDFDTRRLLELEHESVGIYISGHPYEEFTADESRYATCAIRDLVFWKCPDAAPTILAMAGFVDSRHYKRALQMEFQYGTDTRKDKEYGEVDR